MPDTRKNIEILNKHTIMIISYNDSIIKEFTELMHKLNIRTYSSGNLSIDTIIKYNPDILLTDIPKTFIETDKYIEDITTKTDAMVFILVDELTDYDIVTHCINNGAVSYIEKPLNYIHTVRELSTHIKNKKKQI